MTFRQMKSSIGEDLVNFGMRPGYDRIGPTGSTWHFDIRQVPSALITFFRWSIQISMVPLLQELAVEPRPNPLLHRQESW